MSDISENKRGSEEIAGDQTVSQSNTPVEVPRTLESEGGEGTSAEDALPPSEENLPGASVETASQATSEPKPGTSSQHEMPGLVSSTTDVDVDEKIEDPDIEKLLEELNLPKAKARRGRSVFTIKHPRPSYSMKYNAWRIAMLQRERDVESSEADVEEEEDMPEVDEAEGETPQVDVEEAEVPQVDVEEGEVPEIDVEEADIPEGAMQDTENLEDMIKKKQDKE